MSYRWQIDENSQWRDLPNNQEIEEDYCNPANTQHAGSSHIDFDTMTCGSAKVRRFCMGHSEWVWYWEEDEDLWRLYKNSEELERRYLNGETTMKFTARHHQYELNLSDMIQINIKTNTARLMRRRPVFQNALEEYYSSGIPTYWDPNLLPSVGYERIKLERSSPEYSAVLSLFNRTMQGPGWNIISIERIQNLLLWNFFKLQRDTMKTKAGKEVDERLLFHGTERKYVDTICRDNIDWRLCGKNGTLYGEGSYFARDAEYSDSYARDQGTKSMFVCQVLVGDFTTGKGNYKKPPFKDKQNRVAFDSCVNNIDQPSIFVIFEKSQIYPEYLIQYEEDPIEDTFSDTLSSVDTTLSYTLSSTYRLHLLNSPLPTSQNKQTTAVASGSLAAQPPSPAVATSPSVLHPSFSSTQTKAPPPVPQNPRPSNALPLPQSMTDPHMTSPAPVDSSGTVQPTSQNIQRERVSDLVHFFNQQSY